MSCRCVIGSPGDAVGAALQDEELRLEALHVRQHLRPDSLEYRVALRRPAAAR